LIAISNLLVLCSLEYESFGLVLVEAMVQGLPVIETRIGGVSEVVLDGINGLLVPPGDSLALAAAIQSLLSDRRLSAKMGRKGRELFEKRFSVTRMVDEVKKVYFAF
jgi:glycosyltransferase involved in cell wall biosynthesis